MIGLDTNVLVRYVVQDDPEQAAVASQIIESLSDKGPGFVSTVTLVELYWVMRRAYRLGEDEALDVLRHVLASAELVVQDDEVARRALSRARDGAGFADALIAELGARAGCSDTVTFDERAARLPGMRVAWDVPRDARPAGHPPSHTT